MKIEIDNRSAVSKSYQAERARALFNVDEEDGAGFKLVADVPVEEQGWQIGVVVGPSGSGKTSVGRALVQEHNFAWWTGGEWAKGRPIIDEVGGSNFDAATGVLSQVGLGSVPAWLRPHHVLSNGEQFRASLAQLLLKRCEINDVVIDEFTSVLDRTVATVGSGAFAKAWRKQLGRRAVLLTPHRDILDWLQPDWVFDTETEALARGWLQAEAADPDEGLPDGVEVLDLVV